MLNTPHLRSVAGARPRCKAPAMHSECSCPSPRSGESPLRPIAAGRGVRYGKPMTTELLFRDDAYLRTASARVVAVHERGIELDRTIFYPQGGGQVGDSGTL